MPRLAAFVTPGRSLDEACARAQRAEELGYDLVLDNHIANRDGLITLAAYGAATSTVQLGTGVYPALHQTALSLAHQAATLDEIIGGRLVLGIGTSHRPVVEGFHGLTFPASPVTAMREIVAVLRGLFVDGRVATDGEYARAHFQLTGWQGRAQLPIYLSALSPGMLRLAGEVADGVVLWMCGPGYIRDVVVPAIGAGAERAGRDPAEVDIVAAVSCALTDHREPALERLRSSLFVYLNLPFYRAAIEGAGFGDELARFDAGEPIPERLLDHLHAVGDETTLRAKLDEYREAGVTTPGVGPLVAEGSARFEDVLAAAAT